MKLNYYGYLLQRHSDGQEFAFDISPFLKAFHSYQDVDYKNRFHYGGENLYLIEVSRNVYLFLMSKSNEIIKKFRETDQSVTGLLEMLTAHEKIGFASYVIFGDGYLGFASTVLAPKALSFGKFINDILESVGLGDYRFIMRPFFHEVAESDAMVMPFHGKAAIQINKENGAFDDLVDFFKGDGDEFNNVESMEIIFKPKFRKNIDSAVKKVIQNLPKEGLEKFVVRAKENAHDQLVDMFITGKGAISDMVKKGSDWQISDNIKTAAHSNELLQVKVQEHRSDANIKQETPMEISARVNANAWSDFVDDIPANN